MVMLILGPGGLLCWLLGASFLRKRQVFRTDVPSSQHKGRGIIFQIGCGNGNVPFHCGANPDNATTTAMARIGDANTGQGSPKERMTRIDHRDSLLRSDYQANRGSELIRVKHAWPSRSPPRFRRTSPMESALSRWRLYKMRHWFCLPLPMRWACKWALRDRHLCS
jgi:hypothetical protein